MVHQTGVIQHPQLSTGYVCMNYDVFLNDNGSYTPIYLGSSSKLQEFDYSVSLEEGRSVHQFQMNLGKVFLINCSEFLLNPHQGQF